MAGRSGCLTGCLTKLILWSLIACACAWALLVLLHPWALHIGGRSTPLLYWHGMGTVTSKDGKTYPLYLMFFPGRSQGFHGGGRREGKIVNAHLQGTGYLCLAPGNIERMKVSGTMYGGYLSDRDSLLDFRLLEWRKPFSFNYQNRGYFDVAGTWHGQDLVLDRPGEQGLRLNSGPFLDHTTGTLRWASYEEFEAACRTAETGK